MIPIPDKQYGRRSLGRSLAIFLLSFLALELAWSQARGTRLEHWVIDGVTVQTSVALIDLLTPAAAVARGPSIVSPGGGINVRYGCEGTEILFLLVAAVLAYPFPWRLRLAGIALGTVYVFVMNQARLLALFYAIRNDPTLFGPLHGVVTPLVFIVSALAFFVALLNWERRWRPTAARA